MIHKNKYIQKNKLNKQGNTNIVFCLKLQSLIQIVFVVRDCKYK